jgi:hypothetical protein
MEFIATYDTCTELDSGERTRVEEVKNFICFVGYINSVPTEKQVRVKKTRERED